MLVVDTSVWIDAFASRDTAKTRRLKLELSRQRVGVPDLVLCEVLQGIRHDRDYRNVSEHLLGMHMLDVTPTAVWLAAAPHSRLLRSRGVTVRSTIDCLIATFCIQGGHELLHHDHDFDHFEGELGLKILKD